MENQNQLAVIINESGLEKSKAQILLENFSNYFEIASEWEQKAKSLIVTREDQKAEMKMAREGRLFLKEKRVAIENTRKQLKEQSLREGQTIDSIARILKNLIEPIETHLEEQEKFIQIQEEKRLGERFMIRQNETVPYFEFIPYGLDLKNMNEDDYQKLLNGAKLQLQAKKDAEKKAEQERLAREKAEAEEKERIRQENERLRKEADEKEIELTQQRAKAEAERRKAEEKARKERELIEAKLRAEREAKVKVEAELKAKAEAEENARKEAEKARKKAEAAPDKQKLLAFAEAIDNIKIPVLRTEKANKIMNNVRDYILKLTGYIHQETHLL